MVLKPSQFLYFMVQVSRKTLVSFFSVSVFKFLRKELWLDQLRSGSHPRLVKWGVNEVIYVVGTDEIIADDGVKKVTVSKKEKLSRPNPQHLLYFDSLCVKYYLLCILNMFYPLMFSMYIEIISHHLLINIHFNDFCLLLKNLGNMLTSTGPLKSFFVGVIVADNHTFITNKFVLFNSLWLS